MSKEDTWETVSYSDDALADMRAEQQRRWKLEDEDRKAAALEVSRQHELKYQRNRLIRDIWEDFCVPILIVALVIGAIIMAIFGINKWAHSDDDKERARDAAWNTSCTQAGGVVAFGDTSTTSDNLCTFKNGLTEEYYAGDYYRNRIKSHEAWSNLCAEAGGKATTKDEYDDVSKCVFPNGFSVSNKEG